MHLNWFIFMTLIISAFATENFEIPENSTIIFEDDFNRNEQDDSKEELGKNWKTNSTKRAKGIKQADLKDGVLNIKMAKEADHAVSVLHTNPFDDGIVKVKFKMMDSKGIKFNFNDPKARKVAWAGHVCSVAIKPSSIQIVDQLTGYFRLDIHKLRKEGKKKEAAKLCKNKSVTSKFNFGIDKWYEITMIFEGAKLTVYIDNQKVIDFTSPGLDHQMKDNLAFSVSGEAEVDDLKIYSLE